ncbi:MAG: PspC domain-containing protein [Candidatus Kryptonium sp.]|nr:PspC domain-containing protein [Candidatus Kryptonium sp.]MCX7761380.1 PspC domain-containing protein [Candidatus Kryptonium sp.]
MRRLYKSRRDWIIDGVCGGIGEYLGVDPVIIRIIFILLFFMGGVGLLLYIAAMLIIPVNPEHKELKVEEKKGAQTRGKGFIFILGLALIIVGVGLLLENLGLPFWHFLKVGASYAFPILLIAIGLFLIITYLQREQSSQSIDSSEVKSQGEKEGNESVKRLYKSRKNRMIFGVCGGLGEYLNTDPTVVRILWVILAISSLGIAILLYLIMAIIVPEEPTS